MQQAPTAADCLEAILRIAVEVEDDGERKRALDAIAEAAGDPAKMQALLQSQAEEEPVETEADRALVEGPEEEPGSMAYARNGDLAKAIHVAAQEADPNPSDDQKKAGNYRKGHVTVQGLRITIENARGSTRSGKGQGGKPWSVEMKHHYGYIKRTESEADGDHIDVFIGPDPESEIVFVIDQQHPGGRFDEHKCMLGFYTEGEARRGYLDCFSAGWEGLGNVTAMTMSQFKHWIAAGDTAKRAEAATPVSYAATFPSPLNQPILNSASVAAAKPAESETVTEVVVPEKTAEEEPDEEETDSLIEVPNIQQDELYDSGAACAMAVGQYFNVGPKTLAEWRKALGTTDAGVSPWKIEAYLDDLGLETDGRTDMTLDDLEECWRNGQPVICPTTAYENDDGKATTYSQYLVVIGRKYGYVFAHDPLSGEPEGDAAPGRVMIEEAEFVEDWWDKTPKGGRWVRLGVVVGPMKTAANNGQNGEEEVSVGTPVPMEPAAPISAASLDRPEVKETVETLLRQVGVADEEIQPVIEEAKALLEEEQPPAPPNPVMVEHPWKKQFLALADRAEKDGDKASAAIYRRQAEEIK